MTEGRQFVAVTFRSGGRAYTYHNDGPPLAPGDKARVEGRDGKGLQEVDVVEIIASPPPFATKPLHPAQAAQPKAEPAPPADLFGPDAGAASFQEDASLGARSWGRGRSGSIPKTHGAEGRNYVD